LSFKDGLLFIAVPCSYAAVLAALGHRLRQA